jgi:hypothetical protein
VNRREYLDWLRGVAVLIMIEAHTLDSWTRMADRESPWYGKAIILAGFGAPLFLFLAGVALMLAAGSRIRKGLTIEQAARAAFRRGAWVFLLAFLFRLQSFLPGGAQFPRSLLKVDILNVMGVSMLMASIGLVLRAYAPSQTAVLHGPDRCDRDADAAYPRESGPEWVARIPARGLSEAVTWADELHAVPLGRFPDRWLHVERGSTPHGGSRL